MSLQEDVLETIGPEGIEKDRLRERVGNIGQEELEGTVNVLMRAGRVRLAFGRYETIQANGKHQETSSPIPGAEEEAPANLQPATRVCNRCGEPKELNAENFSRNRHGFLRICKRCYRLAVSAGSKGKMILVSTPQTNGSDGSSGVEGHACDGSPSLTGPRTSEDQVSPAAPSATPGTTLTGEGSQPPAGEPLRSRELRPDQGVYERAKAIRQGALNHIAVLEVDIANQRATIAECDRFLELYEWFTRERA